MGTKLEELGAGWGYGEEFTDAVTNQLVQAAPGVDELRNYITDIVVTNNATHAITFDLLDGSGGDSILGQHQIPASDKLVIHFVRPVPQPTANTGLYLTTTETSGYGVYVGGFVA